MAPIRDGNDLHPRSIQLQNGSIVGIAIAGAILLFATLVTMSLTYLRRKHRQEHRRVSEVEGGGHVDMGMKSTTRYSLPPEASFAFSRRLSFNPFMPLEDDDTLYHDWTGEDGLQSPPKRKPSRLSSQRALFRISGMRDSWPLVSNIPMSLRPGQSSSNIMLRNVAAPGYEISQEPKWPKRTLSRTSRPNRPVVSVSRNLPPTRSPTRSSPSPTKSLPTRTSSKDPYSPTKPKFKPHGRSTSENHLSTILRSTSQRLKSTKKKALTRTLTTLERDLGIPPSEKLPDPPKKSGKPTESREALLESDHDDSVASSVYDLLRSPSPAKRSPRKLAQINMKRPKSETPSVASEDSLCAVDTPDLIIPGPLTSPSKNGFKGEQRHRMRITSGGASDISALIYRDTQPSLAKRGPLDMRRSLSLSSPHRISLASDPFYSHVKSSKPMIPQNGMHGPRPLYIRKATFGQEATTERPKSMISPLTSISGNVQTSPKKPNPPPHSNSPAPSLDLNPFQWSPQEIIQTRSTQSSPTRRKGHKRSKIVRLSQLPRPCSVAVVPEENEEETTPLKFHIPLDPPIRFSEPTKSPSPAPSNRDGRKLSSRPPSSATFNPALNSKDSKGRSRDNSTTLGMEEIINMYSPTLGPNYYTEEGASEDEFFAPRDSSSSPRSRRLSRISNELFLFSGLPPAETLTSFPPPESTIPQRVQRLSTPPTLTPRPLPSILALSTPTIMQSKAATPAPPLLTIPIPGHLTGPRAFPTRHDSILSQSRHSPMLQNTIGMLRRMNSEASTFDGSNMSPVSLSSPGIPGPESVSNFASTRETSPVPDENSERGRSRGSKHYLSIGGGLHPFPPQSRSPSRPRRGVEKRDSHRVYKERRKRRNDEIENEIGSGLINELTPVREVSSPAVASEIRGLPSPMGLRFPTLSSTGRNLATPPSEMGRYRRSPVDSPKENPIGLGIGLDGPSIRNAANSLFSPSSLVDRQSSPDIDVSISELGISVQIEDDEELVITRASSTTLPQLSPSPFKYKVRKPQLEKPEHSDKHKAIRTLDRGSDSNDKSPSYSISTRQESTLHHPAPRNTTPPKWIWCISGIGPGMNPYGFEEDEVSTEVSVTPSPEKDTKKDDSNGKGKAGREESVRGTRLEDMKREGESRPVSLGLYDQDGFLRSSPDREGALERERRKRWLRDC